MKVFLLKEVPQVGNADEMVNVTEGFARNFLFPRKLALEVTSQNQATLAKRAQTKEKKEEVVATKTSQLAEKFKSILLVLKRQTHDGGELYAPIRPIEIVELLAEKGFPVAKNQIGFNKSIKTTGLHHVTIKLSSTLQPTIQIKIVAE
ncbi:MAG: 50S ribosomal protein L9 [Candidatus Babeliaceae bacterium]